MATPTLSDSVGEFRSLAASLFAEWRDELAAFARERFAGALSSGAQFVRLDLDGADTRVCLVEGETAREIGRVSGAGIDGAREISALLAASESVPRGTADVVVELPQTDVLRRRFELPAASRRTLAEAVPFEVERLSPIEPERLYCDFTVIDMGRNRKQAEIELRIVKRAVVDQALALARAAGLNVAAIQFEGDRREASWRSFPLDRAAFLRLKWRRWNVLALVGLAVALFACVIFAAYLRGAAASDALSAEVETASERATVVHRLAHDIADVRAQIEFPLAQKRAPLLLAVLSEVSRVLPNGTWLTEFAADGGKIHIQGFSKSPSDIVGSIDRSSMFANAQFVAPLQSAQDGAERFDLSFEVTTPTAKRGPAKRRHPR